MSLNILLFFLRVPLSFSISWSPDETIKGNGSLTMHIMKKNGTDFYSFQYEQIPGQRYYDFTTDMTDSDSESD